METKQKMAIAGQLDHRQRNECQVRSISIEPTASQTSYTQCCSRVILKAMSTSDCVESPQTLGTQQ